MQQNDGTAGGKKKATTEEKPPERVKRLGDLWAAREATADRKQVQVQESDPVGRTGTNDSKRRSGKAQALGARERVAQGCCPGKMHRRGRDRVRRAESAKRADTWKRAGRGGSGYA